MPTQTPPSTPQATITPSNVLAETTQTTTTADTLYGSVHLSQFRGDIHRSTNQIINDRDISGVGVARRSTYAGREWPHTRRLVHGENYFFFFAVVFFAGFFAAAFFVAKTLTPLLSPRWLI